MLGKIEGGRRRGRERMRWLDGITDSMDMGFGQGGLVCCGSWGCKELDMSEQLNWVELLKILGLPWWLSKESARNAGDLGSILGEDPLEKGMATHSSILAWRIPWTEAWRTTVHGDAKRQTWLSDYCPSPTGSLVKLAVPFHIRLFFIWLHRFFALSLFQWYAFWSYDTFLCLYHPHVLRVLFSFRKINLIMIYSWDPLVIVSVPY